MEYRFGEGLVKSKVVEDMRRIESGEIGEYDLFMLKGIYKADLVALEILVAAILFAPSAIGLYWMVFEQWGNQILYYSGIIILIAVFVIWGIVFHFVDKVTHERTKRYYKYAIRRIRRIEKEKRNGA